MRLEETNIKIRCEMPNCKAIATYKIVKDGFLKNAGLFLCKECLTEVYKTLGSHIVPKSPNNMLNRKITTKKTKGEEINAD
ncbi:MAG: hypothetical protein E7356_00870 [Clostridiales bacterium]|nr:hypothetical protein [Clostridiales bacterium]